MVTPIEMLDPKVIGIDDRLGAILRNTLSSDVRAAPPSRRSVAALATEELGSEALRVRPC